MRRKKTQNTNLRHMKPLSKKFRKLSLIGMLVLFLILGPIVLGYSMGIRFDQLGEKFQWIKTGGIYIHSNISNTEVYLDGKFVKNSGLLVRNTFIQNLRSGTTHRVEVYKDGYYGWVKELTIFESLVTEARTLMLPKEIDKTEILPFLDNLGNGVLGATSTVATTGVAASRNAITINPEYVDMQVLFGLASSTESDSITNKIADSLNNLADSTFPGNSDLEIGTSTASSTLDLPEYFAELGIEDPDSLENLIVNSEEVSWLDKGNVIINWVGKEGAAPYYYCNVKGCRTQITLDWNTDIYSFAFLPGRNDVLVVLNESGVWAVEVDDRSVRNIQPIYLGENLDFRINSNNRITILDDIVFYELRF